MLIFGLEGRSFFFYKPIFLSIEQILCKAYYKVDPQDGFIGADYARMWIQIGANSRDLDQSGFVQK